MQVISGKPEYVARRMREFVQRGYIELNRTKWSDGTLTVKLVNVRVSK